MKQLFVPIAALLTLTWLAGCGQSPMSSADRARPVGGAPFTDGAPMRSPMQPPALGQPQMGQPGMPAPGAQAEAERLKAGLRQALDTSTGAELEIKMYSEGHYKTGKKVDELRRSTSRAKLTWGKPDKIRGEVLETTNPLAEGAALATSDGRNMRLKAKGLLGLFPISVTATDPKLSNNRNHSFKDTAPRALLGRLTSPESRWMIVGDTQVDGQAVRLVSIEGVRRLDNEITREVLGLDPVQMRLYKLTMYAGTKPVIDMTFKGFRWNPRITASMFTL